MTDRKRQEKFCRDFGEAVVAVSIADMLRAKGLTVLDVLPDEMVAELASRMARKWRETSRLNVRNRRAAS